MRIIAKRNYKGEKMEYITKRIGIKRRIDMKLIILAFFLIGIVGCEKTADISDPLKYEISAIFSHPTIPIKKNDNIINFISILQNNNFTLLYFQ